MEDSKPTKTGILAPVESQANEDDGFVEAKVEKGVRIRIYHAESATGDAHFVKIDRRYPGKKDAEGKVTKWNSSPRLYAKHLKALETAAREAYKRVTALDTGIDG